MIRTFTCLHCGNTLPRNHRLKNKQHYCSKKECQQASKRAWKKKQYNNNKIYRKKNLESQQAWREQRPAHQYMSEYRQAHPEYVSRNRKLQKTRNKKRQKQPSPMIVNGNLLSLQPSDGGTYALIQVKNRKIVNGNSLLVRMQILSGEEMILAQNRF
jgi:hypothetical protein